MNTKDKLCVAFYIFAILIILALLTAPHLGCQGIQVKCKIVDMWEEPGHHTTLCPPDCDIEHAPDHYAHLRAIDGREWKKIWITEEEFYSNRWNSRKTIGFVSTNIKGDK